MNWQESFKILEIEPTRDKREIKIAYSKILKKYHPEEYPELSIKINEAYKNAIEYAEMHSENVGTIYFENKDIYENKKNYENSRTYIFDDNSNNEENEEYGEEFEDILNGEYEKSREKKIEIWIRKFHIVVQKNIRPLKEWKKFFGIYNKDFDRNEKEEILKSLKIRKVNYGEEDKFYELPEVMKKLTNIEIAYLVFNIMENKSSSLLKGIVDDYTSSDNQKKQSAMEKFIKTFLYIEPFKIFNKIFRVYPSSFKNMKIRKFFGIFLPAVVNEFQNTEYVNKVLDINKTGKSFLKIKDTLAICASLQMAIAILLLTYEMEVYLWNMWIISTFIIVLIGYILIKTRKNFQLSTGRILFNYLYLSTTVVYTITYNIDWNFNIFYVFEYVFLMVFITCQLFIFSQTIYKKLEKFTEHILDIVSSNVSDNLSLKEDIFISDQNKEVFEIKEEDTEQDISQINYVNNWIEELKRVTKNNSGYKDIEIWKQFVDSFRKDFGRKEQEIIKNIIIQEKIFDQCEMKDIEKEYFNYYMGLEKYPEIEKYISSIYKNEFSKKITEEFIERYFDIKYFKLLGLNLWLFSNNKKENVLLKIGRIIISGLKNEFLKVNKIIQTFGIQKKERVYIGILESLLEFAKIVGFIFILIGQVYIVGIVIIYEIFCILLERNFQVSKDFSITGILVLTIIGYSSISPIMRNYDVFVQCIFIFLLLMIKTYIISKIRYKRLEKAAEEILKKFL